MKYQVALSKAWSQLQEITKEKNFTLRFLNDNYTIDLENRRVLSSACNVPVKPYYSILILHYLTQKLLQLPLMQGEWISFKELSGGQPYYPAFKKRVLELILRKYKDKPEGLMQLNRRFACRKESVADISVALDVFDNVEVLITFWRGDEEFGPEANMLFDKNISNIFCTEDIVVLAEIIAHSI